MRLRISTTRAISAFPSSEEVMRFSLRAWTCVSYIVVGHGEGAGKMSGFYGIAVARIDGIPDLLGALRGKVTLAVNVASQCGLTPQYQGLEELQRELGGEGFTIVGFPCNQFGGQEPGGAAEIVEFCRSTYGVTFPMSAKIEVNGPKRHPVYEFLTSAANGIPGDITWNFEKFLIGRDGRVLKRYPPETRPRDNGLMQDIAEAL